MNARLRKLGVASLSGGVLAGMLALCAGLAPAASAGECRLGFCGEITNMTGTTMMIARYGYTGIPLYNGEKSSQFIADTDEIWSTSYSVRVGNRQVGPNQRLKITDNEWLTCRLSGSLITCS
ncbi:hypothetical protein [Lentzea sp. HUAS12]|uniref:hypothetical protein n=1 Tax=Lentzea sp. HUAS12 TaxID=2951806 RepID=UPI0020A11B6C|nr:hypothetical protein [Lentzea sp. HUAS12]USX56368.1 hypothetical protein ND450_20375 [Lentzea sp. HUAS12]